MKKAVFRYSRAVTKGLKKVTNLFQVGLFPHKKVKFAHLSTKQVCNVKKKHFQCLVNVNVNFLIYMIEISVEYTKKVKFAKWRSLWRHIWRHHILTNFKNAKIISEIPSTSNLRRNKKSCVFKRELFINPKWRPKDGLVQVITWFRVLFGINKHE